MKKKKCFPKRRLILLICIVVVIGAYLLWNGMQSDEITVVSKIEEYSYQLESNQTKIFKKYYNDLKEELEDNRVDEEQYATLVSKLFLIDFYTLSNKVTNQDIGGVQFLSTSIRENFQEKATDTIYKYVKSNIYGNRRQELPTVKDVEIEDIQTVSYEYQEKIDNQAFQVKAQITYKKDLGYDSEKTLILVHEENKLVIVEMQ